MIHMSRFRTKSSVRRFGAIVVATAAVVAVVPRMTAAEAPPKITAAGVETVAVDAHYRLSYNGLDVGHLDVVSSVHGKAYSISGSGAVSVLFGALKWSGASSASGEVEHGTPAPKKYDVEWRAGKKTTTVKMAFRDNVATDVVADPPAKLKHDTVPLLASHKVGTLDPFSAMVRLTKVSDAGPCDRRVPIFDGWQRFDLVMSFKRKTMLPAEVKGGAPVTGYVCRLVYRPVAGHRANDDTKAYVANNDVEVVLRPIAGTSVLIPHSVSIPTAWGTGTMTMKRIEITSPAIGKIALSE